MIRKHLYISGRVQGVFFRAHTRDKAISLNIRGWVKNLPDGRVEAVIEGSHHAVEEMLKWCRTGEPPARVDGVEVVDEEPQGVFKDFRIVR
ncbi:MAG: acylphosphatase [Peptococcaceae bacterium]|nr:acylphosphatase [Peptococcaceae bacterium]